MKTNKIRTEQIQVLSEKLQKASEHLARSFEVTQEVDVEHLSSEESERIDAMTMRFVRTYNTLALGLLPKLYSSMFANAEPSVDSLYAFAAAEGIVDQEMTWRAMGISLAEISEDLSTLGDAKVIRQFIGFTPTLLEASRRAIAFAM